MDNLNEVPSGRNPVSSVARRLLAIAARTSDPDVAELAEELVAMDDRQMYSECAISHICDAIGLDPHDLPDPLRPRLYLSPVGAEVSE